MTGKAVRWQPLPFSDTFLSVLSVIREAPEPSSRLCTKAFLCERCTLAGSLTSQYRHSLFSAWPLSLACSTKPQQKTSGNLQSFLGLVLTTDWAWNHLLLADRWPRSQHSTPAPAQLASSPGRPGHSPHRDIRLTWHLLPNHSFSSVGYRIDC